MSWQATLLEGPVHAEAIEESAFQTSPAELDEGPLEQFRVAVAQARAIALSGAIGEPAHAEVRFSVTLNGHYHQGDANSYLGVSVTQAPSPA